MVFPIVTAVYAAVLGLILAGLSIWVITGRVKSGILHGDGGQDNMNRRVRSQANFTEYVPLILLLDALLESSGSSGTLINVLLLILVIARLMHPFGMVARDNSLQQRILRGGGASATLVVLIVSAATLLLHCIARASVS